MSNPSHRAPSRRRFLGTAARAGLAAPLAASTGRLAAESGSAVQAPAPSVPSVGGNETTLTFAGDFFLTQPFPERLEPGTEQVFEVLRRSGAAFANLENGLSTAGSGELGGYRWGAPLRGHPSLAKEIARAGVDVVSTANNHTCNFGRDALLETLKTLDGAGIRHAGGGRTIDEAFQPTRIEVNGLKIAFFSLYSCHYNRVSQEVATATLPGVAVARAYDVLLEMPGNFEERNVPPNVFGMSVNPPASVMAPLREDVLRLAEAIRKGKGDADVAILYVHFHWARHTKSDVPYHQRVVAHAAIDAGIDMFVAHGPHTLRGVEIYRGKPVLFSIGNFILQRQAPGRPAPESSPGHQSVVVRAAVAEKQITRLEFLPIAIGHDGQPRFAADDIGRGILHRISGFSAEFGTALAHRDWYGVLEVGSRAAARTAQP